MTISRSIHVATNDIILSFFYSWVIFHCMYVPHLFYPFLHQWTFKFASVTLKNLKKKKLSFASAIPLLSIYLKKTIIQKDTSTPVFTIALFTTAEAWKQPRCPSTWALLFILKCKSHESRDLAASFLMVSATSPQCHWGDVQWIFIEWQNKLSTYKALFTKTAIELRFKTWTFSK